MFGIVEPSARMKTGNDTSCFAERNEELSSFFWESIFRARGGFHAYLIDDEQERNLLGSVQEGDRLV